MRTFNTAGPCRPELHYMLPAAERLPEVQRLVDESTYFVVHAPRQVGKTTALMALARALTEAGRYAAVLVSMEVGAAFASDVGKAELAILDAWRSAARYGLPAELQPPEWPEAAEGRRIARALEAWASECRRPLVLFLDEIDALRGDTLVSVLRQLRDGYRGRPKLFPWSLALVGMRDVRDYKLSDETDERLLTASPFNVKSESLTLADFTAREVEALYGQHTADTGQRFERDALARVFERTRGQPWLVNAVGRQLVRTLVQDLAIDITARDVDRAAQILVERRDTHLDSLADRLREPRIRAIIEPMIAGTTPEALSGEDVRFAIDLGLVRETEHGGLEIANPIYREVIVRELAVAPRASLPSIAPTWLRTDGRIDFEKLLEAFIAFWRQHGEPLLRTAPYHEIAPHLVLMAFLQRVANGGGTIEREYAIGRGRLDLVLSYGPDRFAIELKVWRDGVADPRAGALEQLDGYLAGLGLDRGWLVIFDRRTGVRPIAERTTTELHTTPGGRRVAVVRA